MTGFGKNFSGVMDNSNKKMASFGKNIVSSFGKLFAIGAGIKIIKDASARVIEFEERLAAFAMNSERMDKSFLAKLKDDMIAIGKETGIFKEDLLTAMDIFVEKTGDVDYAEKALPIIAKVSKASNSAIGDISSASADLKLLWGAMPEDLEKYFDILSSQGRSAAFTLKDQAALFAQILPTASTFGKMSGTDEQRLRNTGALLQMFMRGYGNADETRTGFLSAASEIRSKSDLLERVGINVYEEKRDEKGARVLKSLRTIFQDIFTKTKGDPGILSKIFGESSIKGVLPLVKSWKASGMTEFDAFAQAGGDLEFQNRAFSWMMNTTATKLKESGKNITEATDKLLEGPTVGSGNIAKYINEGFDYGSKGFRGFLQKAYSDMQESQANLITNNIRIHIDKNDRVITTTDNMNTETNVKLNTGRLVD